MLELLALLAVMLFLLGLSIVLSDNRRYMRNTVSASNMRRKDSRITGGY